MDKIKALLFFLLICFPSITKANQYYFERITPIQMALKRLSPELPYNKINSLSRLIYSAGERFLIDYRIFILILFVESKFNQNAKSHTGDFSIAQINLSEWKKPVNRKRLVQTGHYLDRAAMHETYAIEIMAEILHLNYQERGKYDEKWYATYHSKTKKYKEAYLKQLDSAYKKISDIQFKL